MRLLGFEIKKFAEDEDPNIGSPVTPQVDDGAINIQGGSHFGIQVDIDGSYRSELDLIHKYRAMALQPEMENAIDDIVNEAIIHNDDGEIVNMVTDDLDDVPETIRKKIRDAFQKVLKLLDFNNFGADIFRKWYIDGRLYYNIVIDNDNPREGIQSLIFIDPRRIKKVRKVTKAKNEMGIEVITNVEEFYIYTDRQLSLNPANPQLQQASTQVGGIPLSKDSVVQVTSGLFDPIKGTVLSHLHKAIRPMNQLRFVEDATVIYRVSRAPERRVFYVDVGNMAKPKAEQYLKNMMTNYRNKLTYDAATGEIRDDRKHMSMLEDFWMPRRGEGKNTEITTLPAGQNLGQMEDVLYFEKKLYRALGVPPSRIGDDKGFSLGKTNEITRDEIKFDKSIDKLRSRFSILFDDLMKIQLTLTGVCTLEEWEEFKQDIFYDYQKDNNFAELKESELLQNRINTLNLMQPFIGVFFSKKWIQEHVLRLDEDEIADMEDQMKEEMADAEENEHPPLAGLPPNPMDGDEEQQPGAPGQPAAAGGGQSAQSAAKANNNINNKATSFFGGQK